MNATTVSKELKKYADKEKATILARFFKTKPGEYGEGDVFCGVVVPRLRALSKKYHALSHKETLKLLHSPIHEERLLALLIMVLQFQTGERAVQKRMYKSYLANTACINNWDLVDLTAHHLIGAFLTGKSKKELVRLAHSSSLWERRIAIVATYAFIRNNQFTVTLRIAKILLHDDCDLIHKAVGWMLREVGKRDQGVEETFLKTCYKTIPRTMLRYAIERFPEKKRQAYLKGTIPITRNSL